MDALGIGAVGDAVTAIVNHFFPDKTQQEKDQAANELQVLMNQFNLTKAQIDVDDDEAKNTDPLQHWRGMLGWVCTAAFAWHYVCYPLFQYVASCLVAAHLLAAVPIPPDLDVEELYPLLLGMLGLGTMHTVQAIKGTA